MIKTYSFFLSLVIAFISLSSCSQSSTIDSYLDELELITNEMVTACQNKDYDKLIEWDHKMKELMIKYEGKDVKVDNMNDAQKARYEVLVNKQVSAALNLYP